MYSNYNYKSLVGQNCCSYEPKSALNLMSNGPSGKSCCNCIHYMSGNGNCTENLYDSMVTIFKTN